jgi:hypothetical protein
MARSALRQLLGRDEVREFRAPRLEVAPAAAELERRERAGRVLAAEACEVLPAAAAQRPRASCTLASSGQAGARVVGLQLGYARTELAREKAADWIADRLARACAPLGTALERTAEDRLVVT